MKSGFSADMEGGIVARAAKKGKKHSAIPQYHVQGDDGGRAAGSFGVEVGLPGGC
jgi:hypothetical protein